MELGIACGGGSIGDGVGDGVKAVGNGVGWCDGWNGKVVMTEVLNIGSTTQPLQRCNGLVVEQSFSKRVVQGSSPSTSSHLSKIYVRNTFQH